MKKMLFVLGDSISLQYYPALSQILHPWFTCLSKKGRDQALQNLDRPEGANGGDSRRVKAYLEELANGGFRADYILLNCGLHDIKADKNSGVLQVPLEEYAENLLSSLALLGTIANPIWVRTTPVADALHNSRSTNFFRYGRDVIRYNDAADRLMWQKEVPVIDLFTVSASLGEEAYCDHVHFTPEVRQLQAAFLAGAILGITRESAQF